MKVAVCGYGKSGLVEELKKCKWTPCSDGGENFCGIGLFGYCPSRPGDNMVVSVAVVVREGHTIFEVTGFCFPDAFRMAALWQGKPEMVEKAAGPLKLAEQIIVAKPGKNLVPYDILVLDEVGLNEFRARMGSNVAFEDMIKN